jgi:hypothetical protein
MPDGLGGEEDEPEKEEEELNISTPTDSRRSVHVEVDPATGASKAASKAANKAACTSRSIYI